MNKFHGIGLSVQETQDVTRVIVSKAERGSMLHRQPPSVQPRRRRRRGYCGWKEKMIRSEQMEARYRGQDIGG